MVLDPRNRPTPPPPPQPTSATHTFRLLPSSPILVPIASPLCPDPAYGSPPPLPASSLVPLAIFRSPRPLERTLLWLEISSGVRPAPFSEQPMKWTPSALYKRPPSQQRRLLPLRGSRRRVDILSPSALFSYRHASPPFLKRV